ncbi:proton-coupled zinc antiporter SLC30A2 [Anableps anableps]
MFKSKDPERLHILTEQSKAYNLPGSVTHHEELQKDGNGTFKHCHDNSNAQQDRETEKKVASRRLYVVSVICLLFMIGEIVGGYLAGSLAVMTDAAHLLTDLASFVISLFSLWLSSKPATQKLSYGWHRAEILGALLSVFTIWVVTGVLVYLAVERLIHDDYTIEGHIMLITSGCAVVANIIMALTLHQSGHGHSHGGLTSHGHGHSHSPKREKEKNHTPNNLYSNECTDIEKNHASHGKRAQQANASVRAAFVHVMGDLLQSVSVLISAIIIFFKPEYKIADPICTFLFSILVLCTTFTIMRDILLVLMEGTPSGVSYSEVRDRLLAVNGVKAVHNLHIWALTMNQAVLSAHIAIDDSVDAQTVLREMTQACFSYYNFHSLTIQMEQQADLKPGCTLCENPKN